MSRVSSRAVLAGQALDVTVSMGDQTATLPSAVVVPPQPTVSSVSGCADNADGSTSLCPAAGGLSLTLTGTNFANDLVALVGGQVCANLAVTSTTTATVFFPPARTPAGHDRQRRRGRPNHPQRQLRCPAPASAPGTGQRHGRARRWHRDRHLEHSRRPHRDGLPGHALPGGATLPPVTFSLAG